MKQEKKLFFEPTRNGIIQQLMKDLREQLASRIQVVFQHIWEYYHIERIASICYLFYQL